MSRAISISVFMVVGCSPLTSSAQASAAFSSVPPAVMVTAAAKLISDDLRRNARRLTPLSCEGGCGCECGPECSLMDVSSDLLRVLSCAFSLEAAVPLQNLDLVTVRILDVENLAAGEQMAHAFLLSTILGAVW